MVWHEERMLVGGKLVEAADGATFDNVNPATEELIGAAADGSESDMDAAIAAARVAFDETPWATDVPLRVRCLRQLHEGLLRHADELRETIVAEVGCPVLLTSGPQLDTPTGAVAWIADFLERYPWEEDIGFAEMFGLRSHRTIRREPVGVVGAITPWNFPMQINLAKSRAGTRGRQYRGPQARARYAVGGHAPRADRGRGDGHPGRRPQRRDVVEPFDRAAAG